MKMGYCTLCGNYTVVHGNDRDPARHMMLCDECCPCYNHSPYLGRPWAGKYYEFSMVETWAQRNMIELFCEKEAEK